MPRLKVFQAHLGFFDTVVAAPSQKAALEAWGSRQNLFHNGTASAASDADAISAALAKPGVVLKRLAGSKGKFSEQPPPPESRAVRVPKPATPKGAKAKASPESKPPRGPSKAEEAERAARHWREQRDRLREEFEQRERALREEEQARMRDFDQRERALKNERDASAHEFERRARSLKEQRMARERELKRRSPD